MVLCGSHDDVAAALVQLDDLELEDLVHQLFDRLRRAQRDLAAREEGLDAEEIDDGSALDLPRDPSLDDFAPFGRFLDAVPHLDEVGALLRQHDQAVLVFHLLQEDVDLVPHADRIGVGEFAERDDPFGLEADVDHDLVLVHAQDAPFEDLALLEVLHRILVELEHLLHRLGIGPVLVILVHDDDGRTPPGSRFEVGLVAGDDGSGRERAAPLMVAGTGVFGGRAGRRRRRRGLRVGL